MSYTRDARRARARRERDDGGEEGRGPRDPRVAPRGRQRRHARGSRRQNQEQAHESRRARHPACRGAPSSVPAPRRRPAQPRASRAGARRNRSVFTPALDELVSVRGASEPLRYASLGLVGRVRAATRGMEINLKISGLSRLCSCRMLTLATLPAAATRDRRQRLRNGHESLSRLGCDPCKFFCSKPHLSIHCWVTIPSP